MKIKRHIQAFIANTQDMPLLKNVYRESYRLFTKIIVERLTKEKGIQAIYIHRGLSGNDPVYGLSDIDLIVFVSSGTTDKTIRKIKSTYLDLARIIPPLRKSLDEVGIYSIDEFQELINIVPFYRYRYIIEKDQWKLLWGEDIRDKIKADKSSMKENALNETGVWWKSLSKLLFSDDGLPGIMQGYTWYKALAECSKVYFIIKDSSLIPGRNEALRKLQRELRHRAHLIERVRTFRDNPKFFTKQNNRQILTELITELLTSISDMASSSQSVPEKEISVEINLYSSSLPPIPGVWRNLKIYILPKLEFHPDVLVPRDLHHWEIVIDSPILDVEKLKRFYYSMSNDPEWKRLNWHLLWTNGLIALSVNPLEPWDAIKFPPSDPIFFGAIRREDFSAARFNSSHSAVFPSNYTILNSLVSQRIKRLKDTLEDGNLRKVDNNKFSFFFWSSLRMAMINRQLQKGEKVKIPITYDQIAQGMLQGIGSKLNSDPFIELLDEEKGILNPRHTRKAIEFLKQCL